MKINENQIAWTCWQIWSLESCWSCNAIRCVLSAGLLGDSPQFSTFRGSNSIEATNEPKKQEQTEQNAKLLSPTCFQTYLTCLSSCQFSHVFTFFLKRRKHMLRQCSRVWPWSRARGGLFGRSRGFALVNQSRIHRLRPLAIGAVGAATATAYTAYTLWRREDEIELPAVPEPTPTFKHPYETWPWYQKAWFAFKRSVACL